jgi:hypothetical protein
MVARLDQFAATIADARTQPNLAALADLEQQFLTGFHEVGAHLDPVQVGAAWMILGNLFAGFVGGLPQEQQGCGPVLVNLARLAGARLYTGDRLPMEMTCPFTYGTGAQCKTVIKGSDEKQFDTHMRAHIWQHHEGATWPPEGELPPPAWADDTTPEGRILSFLNARAGRTSSDKVVPEIHGRVLSEADLREVLAKLGVA